ncbi:MAG: hypothetical protein IJY69_03805 [Clostridia bacterium]|nr:hypothetical protein [Clostridia bacterium]
MIKQLKAFRLIVLCLIITLSLSLASCVVTPGGSGGSGESGGESGGGSGESGGESGGGSGESGGESGGNSGESGGNSGESGGDDKPDGVTMPTLEGLFDANHSILLGDSLHLYPGRPLTVFVMFDGSHPDFCHGKVSGDSLSEDITIGGIKVNGFEHEGKRYFAYSMVIPDLETEGDYTLTLSWGLGEERAEHVYSIRVDDVLDNPSGVAGYFLDAKGDLDPGFISNNIRITHGVGAIIYLRFSAPVSNLNLFIFDLNINTAPTYSYSDGNAVYVFEIDTLFADYGREYSVYISHGSSGMDQTNININAIVGQGSDDGGDEEIHSFLGVSANDIEPLGDRLALEGVQDETIYFFFDKEVYPLGLITDWGEMTDFNSYQCGSYYVVGAKYPAAEVGDYKASLRYYFNGVEYYAHCGVSISVGSAPKEISFLGVCLQGEYSLRREITVTEGENTIFVVYFSGSVEDVSVYFMQNDGWGGHAGSSIDYDGRHYHLISVPEVLAGSDSVRVSYTVNGEAREDFFTVTINPSDNLGSDFVGAKAHYDGTFEKNVTVYAGTEFTLYVAFKNEHENISLMLGQYETAFEPYDFSYTAEGWIFKFKTYPLFEGSDTCTVIDKFGRTIAEFGIEAKSSDTSEATLLGVMTEEMTGPMPYLEIMTGVEQQQVFVIFSKDVDGLEIYLSGGKLDIFASGSSPIGHYYGVILPTLYSEGDYGLAVNYVDVTGEVVREGISIIATSGKEEPEPESDPVYLGVMLSETGNPSDSVTVDYGVPSIIYLVFDKYAEIEGSISVSDDGSNDYLGEGHYVSDYYYVIPLYIGPITAGLHRDVNFSYFTSAGNGYGYFAVMLNRPYVEPITYVGVSVDGADPVNSDFLTVTPGEHSFRFIYTGDSSNVTYVGGIGGLDLSYYITESDGGFAVECSYYFDMTMEYEISYQVYATYFDGEITETNTLFVGVKLESEPEMVGARFKEGEDFSYELEILNTTDTLPLMIGFTAPVFVTDVMIGNYHFSPTVEAVGVAEGLYVCEIPVEIYCIGLDNCEAKIEYTYYGQVFYGSFAVNVVRRDMTALYDADGNDLLKSDGDMTLWIGYKESIDLICVYNFEPQRVEVMHDFGAFILECEGYSDNYGGYVVRIHVEYYEIGTEGPTALKYNIISYDSMGEIQDSPSKLVIVNLTEGPLTAFGINTDGVTTGNGSLNFAPGDMTPVFIMINKMTDSVFFNLWSDGVQNCIVKPTEINYVSDGLYAARIDFPSYEEGANYKICVMEGDETLYGIVYSVTYYSN